MSAMLSVLVPPRPVLPSRAEVRLAFDRQGSRGIRPGLNLRTNEAASMLDGVVSVNLSQMQRQGLPKGVYPILSGIQQGRVRYERWDPDETWQTWDQLLEQMGGLSEVRVGTGGEVSFGGTGVARGDCEDLSSAVAAELLYNGIPARTYVYKSGPKLYHVVVATERWGIMDPSRAAGMEGNG